MGFRILVRLFKYFSDERSLSYVYVNDCHKSICDLEDYLRDLFGIDGQFCLTKDSCLLPNSENIALLRTDETVSVIPLTTNFKFFAEKSKSANEVIENETEKEAKKKKRKKNKDIIDETSIHDDSLKNSACNKVGNKENISASLDNNKGIDSPTTPELANKKSKKIENVSLDNSQSIEDLNVTKYDEENAIENMKTKALGLLKDHFQTNINGVSDGRIKKRKRIRIRKGKKNNQVDLSSLSDGENNISQRSDSFVSVTGKINSHKRFPAPSEKTTVAILRNQFDSQNFDNSPRIVRALSPKKNMSVSESICDTSYDASFKHDHVSTEQNTEKSDCLLKTVEHRPLLSHNELPKENDTIAFKMLQMNENYSPVISKYIVGRVMQIYEDSCLLKIVILEGFEECAHQSGKFEIEEDTLDTTNNQQNTIEIQWSQVLEPRLCN